ncbi:MAG: SMR family transporter [Pseudomonadota bacterium]
MAWIYLSLAAAANMAANTLLRQAAQGVKDREGPVDIVLGLLGQPVFWLALAAAGALLLAFTMALRTTPVSLAYPVVTAVAIAGLLVVEGVWLGQHLGAVRVLGVALITAGVAAIFLGAPQQ